MKCNVGKKDRIARIATGLAVIGVGLYLGSGWGAVGLVPLVTGALARCPAYALFGFSGCSKKETHRDESEFSGYRVG